MSGKFYIAADYEDAVGKGILVINSRDGLEEDEPCTAYFGLHEETAYFDSAPEAEAFRTRYVNGGQWTVRQRSE